jgi:hypothetical protein
MSDIESDFSYNPEATAESGEESGTERRTAEGYMGKGPSNLPKPVVDPRDKWRPGPNAVKESKEADEAWGEVMRKAIEEEAKKREKGST